MFIRTERSIKDFIRFYPIISFIVSFNLILWVIVNLLQTPLGLTIYSFGVGHNLSVSSGEYWRLITPIFLHAGFTHFAFNSFALVLFGPALEQMLGRAKFIIAFLITGIAGNLGTFVIDPTANIPHLGASGAIYGLFGIYIFMVFFRKHLIDPGSAQIIKTIFVLGLIMTFVRPNINIAAHLFGFLSGFALGPIILNNVRPFSISRNRNTR